MMMHCGLVGTAWLYLGRMGIPKSDEGEIELLPSADCDDLAQPSLCPYLHCNVTLISSMSVHEEVNRMRQWSPR